MGQPDGVQEVNDPGAIAELQAVKGRLPAALDADGGVKVHLQNPAQGTQQVSGAVDVTDRAARQLGAVTGPLTNAELRATAVPVSGPLTDAQLRATAVPVSGPVTDAQLRATPVPVSDGGGSLTVDGPLTDAQLRATAVPVSGPLTNAELRAAAVPVSGPLTDAQLRATAVPVSASSLPLPAGAATEATLATVAKEGAPITGEALEAGGSSVLGWLSSLRKMVQAVRDRLPGALDADGGLKVHSQNLPPGAATEATLAALLTLAEWKKRVGVPKVIRAINASTATTGAKLTLTVGAGKKCIVRSYGTSNIGTTVVIEAKSTNADQTYLGAAGERISRLGEYIVLDAGEQFLFQVNTAQVGTEADFYICYEEVDA